jgi:hypothetical protein
MGLYRIEAVPTSEQVPEYLECANSAAKHPVTNGWKGSTLILDFQTSDDLLSFMGAAASRELKIRVST